jgi:hypothetical protein
MLLLFLSPEVLQTIARDQGLNSAHLFNKLYNFTAFFLYFIFHSRVLWDPLVRKRRQYAAYIALFLVTMFVWRESYNYVYWMIVRKPGQTFYSMHELHQFNAAFWVFVYWANVLYNYFALGVYLAFRYFQERVQLLEATAMQRELELKQLSDQLNPHFLFNALNNIYGYQLSGKKEAGELILKLSELMRYILESSKHHTVPLEKELAFLNDYMSFEQARLGPRATVQYDCHCETQDVRIVPLVLFNFIENAFKHGTASMQAADISIEIHNNNRQLQLSVSNPLRVASSSTSLGLRNTRRRLELLYEDRHELKILQDDGRYQVSLTLQHAS